MSNDFNWISFKTITNGWQAELLLKPEHPAFIGHFPNQAIFPGVSQIELALNVLSFGLQMPLFITEVPYAKFKAAISPNTIIQIQVNVQAKNLASWLITGSQPMFSSGQLKYAEKRLAAPATDRL